MQLDFYSVQIPFNQAAISWCWDQFGMPEALKTLSGCFGKAKWDFVTSRDHKTIILCFYSKTDYDLFFDSGMYTWAVLQS